jgi:hypothetical protein
MIASKQLSITDLFLKRYLHTGITVTYLLIIFMGLPTRCHCAKGRKVMGSIPNGVIGIH